MTTPQPTATTHATPIGHAHAADLETCLEFVNTLSYDDGVARDSLPTVDVAVAFFAGPSIAHEDALRAQAGSDPEAWLARLHDTRSALREVWDAAVEGRTVDAAAIEMLNAVLEHGPHAELRSALAGVAVGHRHAADATGEALARLVEPLVGAIAAGETARFRVCANDGCRWVFEDISRGGRRRWCDMSSCGNRAKARRYRARHRPDEAATA